MDPSISIVNVSCNRCGAPLEVSESTNFVRCSHCGASLKIVQTDSTRFTEEVGEISRKLDVISIQNEIERLDREFQIQAANSMITNKDGSKSNPSVIAGVFAIVVAVVVGIAWMIGTSSMGAPGFFSLFGLVFILVGAGGGISVIAKATSMSSLEQEYQDRRQILLSELQRAQSRSDRD